MFDKGPGAAIAYHRSMLRDNTRTQALERAVAAVVQAGDVVLDIGCGTGILSFFACRAGARRVYAVEQGGIIEIAKAVAHQNGFEDKIVFLSDRSSRVELSERADVLLTETIGNFGLEEGILGTVLDARQRLLVPDCRISPQSLELFIAPIETSEIYDRFEVWNEDLCGFDYSAVRPWAINNPAWVEIEPSAFLSEPGSLGRLELATVETDLFSGVVTLVATRSGTLHGLCGWFGAELAEGVMLSNAPPLATPNWWQIFLALDVPLVVAEGDRLKITVSAFANGTIWRWRVKLAKSRGGEVTIETRDQSTFFGSLLSPSDLAKSVAG